MDRGRRRWMARIGSAGASLVVPSARGGATPPLPGAGLATIPSPPAVRMLKWAELVPAGWDPNAGFRKSDAGTWRDSDPRTRRLLEKLRDVWDHAPTVAGFDGTTVRMPGYIVPVDLVNGALKSLLLVPYFGACIHTPPPPANQIILVVPATPVADFRAMDTVWVTGRLSAARADTAAGVGGYRIDAATVERYVGTPTY